MFQPQEISNTASTSGEDSVQCKRRFLSEDAQDVVLNVYNTLLKCMGNRGVIIKTSKITNVPERTVRRIVSAGSGHLPRKRHKIRFSRIDNFTEDSVRRTVYSFYLINEIPTLHKLHQSLISSEVGFNYSETTLWRLLKQLGFKYGKIDDRKVIMESPQLLQEREKIICDIRSHRLAGKNIIYLGETWFDIHDSQDSPLSPSSKGIRLIVSHAGSEQGWVPGALLVSSNYLENPCADYQENMNSEIFEKWFNDQLLPNIPSNSVIIMDNASYHSRQTENTPSINTRKGNIVRFLKSHDIPVPEKSTVKSLLEIVRSHNFEKKYVIDKIAQEAGHQVIRLPNYYWVLNPMELMWSHVKKAIQQSNVLQTVGDGVRQTVQDVVNSIDPMFWKSACEVVNKVEDEFSRDRFQPFITNTNEDTDTEEGEGSN